MATFFANLQGDTVANEVTAESIEDAAKRFADKEGLEDGDVISIAGPVQTFKVKTEKNRSVKSIG